MEISKFIIDGVSTVNVFGKWEERKKKKTNLFDNSPENTKSTTDKLFGYLSCCDGGYFKSNLLS